MAWPQPLTRARRLQPPVPAGEAGVSGLQACLTRLSAPDAFVSWAAPYRDFTSCWRACPHPGWLLWAAARLSSTPGQREQVVCCAAALAETAARAAGLADPAALAAIAAARTRPLGDDRAQLLIAIQDALGVAAEAGALAALEEARAGRLLALAPRRRLSSVVASRALDARLASRAAGRRRSAALAAAWTGRSAAEASSGSAKRWAVTAGRAGTLCLAALSPGPRLSGRAAAGCADAVRSHLSCPCFLLTAPASGPTSRTGAAGR